MHQSRVCSVVVCAKARGVGSRLGLVLRSSANKVAVPTTSENDILREKIRAEISTERVAFSVARYITHGLVY